MPASQRLKQSQELETTLVYVSSPVYVSRIMKNSVVYPEQFMFRKVNHIKLLVTFNQEISVL